MRDLFPSLEVLTEPDKIAPYSHDESHEKPFAPLAVIFPKSTAEVAEVLRVASQRKIPVIPRGAGSGLSGAAVPEKPSIVLSLEKMNRILSINDEDRYAEVQPGVITGDIRRAVEAKGLFYPPIPASVDFCSIGGNIATNAGGLCAVKYGVTREYVLGLEVVLPNGDVIHTGGKYLKNTTGYNLTQLIIGSEGTLGVVTQITLKLLPFPKHRVMLLVPFESLEATSQAILEILREQIIPPTLELLPKEAVECVLARHPNLNYPFQDAVASLLIELDGRDESAMENELESMAQVLEKHQLKPPIVAATPQQKEEIWQVRKMVRDSIANSGDYEEADSVVPRSRVAELVKAAQTVAKEMGLTVVSYGHAGDGNLHTYFRRGNMPVAEWSVKSKEALRRFFERTVALGGTISGEHGIGSLKKEFLSLALSQQEIALMKRLKLAFDPENLLNPGKVLP